MGKGLLSFIKTGMKIGAGLAACEVTYHVMSVVFEFPIKILTGAAIEKTKKEEVEDGNGEEG